MFSIDSNPIYYNYPLRIIQCTSWDYVRNARCISSPSSVISFSNVIPRSWRQVPLSLWSSCVCLNRCSSTTAWLFPRNFHWVIFTLLHQSHSIIPSFIRSLIITTYLFIMAYQLWYIWRIFIIKKMFLRNHHQNFHTKEQSAYMKDLLKSKHPKKSYERS